jgi:hypothetical protein
MTWTDIADQLTPDQITLLRQCDRGTNLRPLAQSFAARNLLQALHADVPPPADASGVCEWRYVNGAAHRFFCGTRRGTVVRVEIHGKQHADGSASSRAIFVTTGNGVELTATEARKAAHNLLAAAYEMEAMTD